MIEISKIGDAIGIKIMLENADLIIIKAKKGYIMCGYLNIEAAEKSGDAACMVKGVKSFEDVLNAKILKATEKAKKLGITEGINGKEALKFLE